MDELTERVAAKIPDKWNRVAILLKLDSGVRNRIENDVKGCLNQFIAVLEEWSRSQSRPYTWKTLISVLKSDSVGEIALAERLEEDFISC